MADKWDPLCSNECSSATEAPNVSGSVPLDMHSLGSEHILLSMCNSHILAAFDCLYDLLYDIKSRHIRHPKVSFQLLPGFTDLVVVCFLFPCKTPSK